MKPSELSLIARPLEKSRDRDRLTLSLAGSQDQIAALEHPPYSLERFRKKWQVYLTWDEVCSSAEIKVHLGAGMMIAQVSPRICNHAAEK